MTAKLSLVAAFVLLGGASALAQTDATATSSKVATDAQGKALIGAPLGFNPAADAGEVEGDAETLFVIESGTAKQAGAWTEADRQACSASGGIELEISAGRIACFNL